MVYTENRQVDDYNPIIQLRRYIDDIGDPDIISYQEAGAIIVKDKNETWEKITTGLESFCKKYCGDDLSDVVQREAESLYMQKLRKASKHLEKLKIHVTEEKLSVIKNGKLKIKLKKPAIPHYVP